MDRMERNAKTCTNEVCCDNTWSGVDTWLGHDAALPRTSAGELIYCVTGHLLLLTAAGPAREVCNAHISEGEVYPLIGRNSAVFAPQA